MWFLTGLFAGCLLLALVWLLLLRDMRDCVLQDCSSAIPATYLPPAAICLGAGVLSQRRRSFALAALAGAGAALPTGILLGVVVALDSASPRGLSDWISGIIMTAALVGMGIGVAFVGAAIARAWVQAVGSD